MSGRKLTREERKAALDKIAGRRPKARVAKAAPITDGEPGNIAKKPDVISVPAAAQPVVEQPPVASEEVGDKSVVEAPKLEPKASQRAEVEKAPESEPDEEPPAEMPTPTTEPPITQEPPRDSKPPEAKPDEATSQAQAPPQEQPAKARAPAGFEKARKVEIILPSDPKFANGESFITTLGLGVRIKCVPHLLAVTNGVRLNISVHPNGDAEPVNVVELLHRRSDGHWCNSTDNSTAVDLGEAPHKNRSLRMSGDTFKLAISSEDTEVKPDGLKYQDIRLYAYVIGLPSGYRGNTVDSDMNVRLVKESKNLSVFSVSAENGEKKTFAPGLQIRTIVNKRKEQSFELVSASKGGTVNVTTAMEFAESKAKKRGDANTNVVRIAYGKKELNAVVSREGRELYLYVSGLNDEEKKGAAAVLKSLGAKASSWWAGKKASASAAWKRRVSEPLARVANIKLKSPDFSVLGKPFVVAWRERSKLLATLTVGGLTSIFTLLAASSVSGMAMQGAMVAGGSVLLASLTYIIFRWDRKTQR